ncbi:hypothetical protein GCM10007938_39880 [Vibrio zhanjiangensis]|uniref:Uncharacterized protein n=1 Tax=Vibrio zhanjiangensis TaxID=1046128 RepID=A0ABQ6F5R5_9VIBR|nr:hypothetical protein [Vibrio zhanjiangensis]GLT20205.1 hypothetical protein GCM10007938_39880 [Vibrio zhanjiangensis]
MNIHYDIQRLQVDVDKESSSLTQQWQNVMNIVNSECYGELARARLAFNLVDYITSDDLQLRLLISRAPQAMAKIAEETSVYKEQRVINNKKTGVVYSRSEQMIPKTLNYKAQYTAHRIVNGRSQTLSSSNLLKCLEVGDTLTPLDGVLFLQCKRIASNIEKLKKRHSHLNIEMKRIDVSDSFTGTKRKMASYRLV